MELETNRFLNQTFGLEIEKTDTMVFVGWSVDCDSRFNRTCNDDLLSINGMFTIS